MKALKRNILIVLLGLLAVTGCFAASTLSARAAEEEEGKITIYFKERESEKDILPSVEIPYGSPLFEDEMPPENFFPVINGYRVSKWVLRDYDETAYDISYGDYFSVTNIFSEEEFGTEVVYCPEFSTIPYTYKIEYLLGKKGENHPDNPTTYTVKSKKITFKSPVRKGYLFEGWYLDSKYKKQIKGIPAGTCVDLEDPSEKDCDVLRLYAKWTSAKPSTPVFSSLKNPSTGKVSVTIKAIKVPAKYKKNVGYELTYASSSSMKAATVVDLKKKLSYSIMNLVKGKTLYFKVRAYITDSTGERVFSSYSKKKSIKVVKGEAEYEATSTSAVLNAVRINKKGNLTVSATVEKRLKSYDDYYYLVSLEPETGKVLEEVAKGDKKKSLLIETPVRDNKGRNLINGRFAIAIKKSKSSYMVVSSWAEINNPEDAADYKAAFPKTTSKKGMQGYKDTDNLGIKHTFYNFIINNMMGGSPYVYNGKTYYFSAPFVSEIASNNKDGIVVTAQLMLRWPGYNYSYLCFGSSAPATTTVAPYYALDVSNKSGREFFEAFFSFLGEKYGNVNCHVDNWIIGNEVNTADKKDFSWYYAGNTSRVEFMTNYAKTFKLLDKAIKSRYRNARCYICCDHTWSDRCGDWGTRPFLDLFSVKIREVSPATKWNLAYHAYPSVLTYSAVWNDNADDRYVTNGSLYSDFVSPLNLEVMTNYVKDNFGKDTRIILSEQGFTSTTGLNVQAAAIAYTYYKAEFNDMIDSVIFRAYQDDYGELSQGLAFGLVGINGAKKPAYDVYKYMDTPAYASHVNQYLGTIGATSWKQVTPAFNESKLLKMPARK